MHIINIILGSLASIGFIGGNLSTKYRRTIFFILLGVLMVSIQYALLGAWAVPAVNAVLLVRAYALIRLEQSAQMVKRIAIYTFLGLVVATLLATGIPHTFIGWLPFIAASLGTIAFGSLNMVWIKTFLIASSFSWAVLDISFHNWQTLVGDAFGVLAGVVALVLLLRMDNKEVVLPGGRLNRGQVIRKGNLILRPASEDIGVEKLLLQVNKVLPTMTPSVRGRDKEGRLKLEWIHGDASDKFDEDETHMMRRMYSIGRLLRTMHDFTAPIANKVTATKWTLTDPSNIHEVVCHGDPSPGNIVFVNFPPSEGIGPSAKALIDWEMAGPGRRAWDLATALRYWAPFLNPENRSDKFTWDPELSRKRAEAILSGYDASKELYLEVAELLPLNQQVNTNYIVRRLKSKGSEVYEPWVAKGGLTRLERDAIWIAKESAELMTAWQAL